MMARLLSKRYSVEILKSEFHPSYLKVEQGSALCWTNTNACSHQLYERTCDSEKDIGEVSSNGTLEHTFSTPGIHEIRVKSFNTFKLCVEVPGGNFPTVRISPEAFIPQRARIRPGQFVKWTVDADVKDQLVIEFADDDDLSPDYTSQAKIGPGDSIARQFPEAGIYKYQNFVLEKMQGEVVVGVKSKKRKKKRNKAKKLSAEGPAPALPVSASSPMQLRPVPPAKVDIHSTADIHQLETRPERGVRLDVRPLQNKFVQTAAKNVVNSGILHVSDKVEEEEEEVQEEELECFSIVEIYGMAFHPQKVLNVPRGSRLNFSNFDNNMQYYLRVSRRPGNPNVDSSLEVEEACLAADEYQYFEFHHVGTYFVVCDTFPFLQCEVQVVENPELPTTSVVELERNLEEINRIRKLQDEEQNARMAERKQLSKLLPAKPAERSGVGSFSSHRSKLEFLDSAKKEPTNESVDAAEPPTGKKKKRKNRKKKRKKGSEEAESQPLLPKDEPRSMDMAYNLGEEESLLQSDPLENAVNQSPSLDLDLVEKGTFVDAPNRKGKKRKKACEKLKALKERRKLNRKRSSSNVADSDAEIVSEHVSEVEEEEAPEPALVPEAKVTPEPVDSPAQEDEAPAPSGSALGQQLLSLFGPSTTQERFDVESFSEQCPPVPLDHFPESSQFDVAAATYFFAQRG